MYMYACMYVCIYSDFIHQRCHQVYFYVSTSYIKLKSHLSALFGTLITQPCQHGLKQDLLKIESCVFEDHKVIFTSLYSTLCSSTGVPRRQRCKAAINPYNNWPVV